jgi:hypothetical protein
MIESSNSPTQVAWKAVANSANCPKVSYLWLAKNVISALNRTGHSRARTGTAIPKGSNNSFGSHEDVDVVDEELGDYRIAESDQGLTNR